MKVAIRVDASTQIGTGHLFRCLTLADSLKEEGAEIHFLCRKLNGFTPQLITSRDHTLHFISTSQNKNLASSDGCHLFHSTWLPCSQEQDSRESLSILKSLTPIDWILVDHYGIDFRWEELVKPFTKHLMVIDDLADRQHCCDILLDQNYYPDLNNRYNNRINFTCRKLLGPKYTLMRPHFLKERKRLKHRDGNIQHVFIFFGGSDLTNETSKALSAIHLLNRKDIQVDVVIGSSNPNKNMILQLASRMPQVKCHGYIENMAKLMARADLAIGAAGTNTWERCCLGIPCIMEILADNQKDIASSVDRLGAGWNLGVAHEISVQTLSTFINELLTSKDKVFKCSKTAARLVDGKGTKRVVNAIQIESITLRVCKESDCELLWQWVNDPVARSSAFKTVPIEWEDHIYWFSYKINDSLCDIFIAENNRGVPIGQIRFDLSDKIVDIDYSIDSQYRGNSLGYTLLKKGIIKFLQQNSQPITFQGRVKQENIASQKIFKSLNFSMVNTDYTLSDCNSEPSIVFQLSSDKFCIKKGKTSKQNA